MKITLLSLSVAFSLQSWISKIKIVKSISLKRILYCSIFATKTQISNCILKPKFISSVCTLLQPNSTWPASNLSNN
jgi:hypothetical protein